MPQGKHFSVLVAYVLSLVRCCLHLTDIGFFLNFDLLKTTRYKFFFFGNIVSPGKR